MTYSWILGFETHVVLMLRLDPYLLNLFTLYTKYGALSCYSLFIFILLLQLNSLDRLKRSPLFMGVTLLTGDLNLCFIKKK